MQRVKRLILSFSWFFIFAWINIAICMAQYISQNEFEFYSNVNQSQQQALDLLAATDTLTTSTLCPHIKPALFFETYGRIFFILQKSTRAGGQLLQLCCTYTFVCTLQPYITRR
jgi:hypothetical protein